MPHEARDGRQPADIANAYLATDQDIETYALAKQVVEGMQQNLPEFELKNPNRYIFVAAFDGTSNDATQTDRNATNVHRLFQDFDNFSKSGDGFSRMHARYIEGPGTQGSVKDHPLDGMDGSTVRDRVVEMYKELGDQAQKWRQQNPNAEISVITFGFSRGAVESAEFASMIGKYGIQTDVQYRTRDDDDVRNNTRTWAETLSGRPGTIKAKAEYVVLSGELVKQGDVPIVAGLFDPVSTGVAEERHDRELPRGISGALQITARDEHRVFFPVDKIVDPAEIARRNHQDIDPQRFANLQVAGCHSDIGGGYADAPGLGNWSNNIMGLYFNTVLGRDVCNTAHPVEPEQCIVHNSNTGALQKIGYVNTGAWYADRTLVDEGRTPDGNKIAPGIKTELHGSKNKEMPYVSVDNGNTKDDLPSTGQREAQTRLHPRQDDKHTPVPKDAQRPVSQLQDPVNPIRMLLESSTAVTNLVESGLSQRAPQLLREALHEHLNDQNVSRSLEAYGDSARGRLSAAVALAAMRHGMDRIGDVAFNEDGTKLILTDRHDTHKKLVKQTEVDIKLALNTPMRDSLCDLSPGDFQKRERNTLYDQALGCLYGHVFNGNLSFKDEKSMQESARNIASQANRDGLETISRLQLVHQQGGPFHIVAHDEVKAHRASEQVVVHQPVDELVNELLERHAPSRGGR